MGFSQQTRITLSIKFITMCEQVHPHNIHPRHLAICDERVPPIVAASPSAVAPPIRSPLKPARRGCLLRPRTAPQMGDTQVRCAATMWLGEIVCAEAQFNSTMVHLVGLRVRCLTHRGTRSLKPLGDSGREMACHAEGRGSNSLPPRKSAEKLSFISSRTFRIFRPLPFALRTHSVMPFGKPRMVSHNTLVRPSAERCRNIDRSASLRFPGRLNTNLVRHSHKLATASKDRVCGGSNGTCSVVPARRLWEPFCPMAPNAGFVLPER
jgi:hypothetical protein